MKKRGKRRRRMTKRGLQLKEKKEKTIKRK